MRKYGHGGRLETVICNGCGKKLVVEDGIVREGGTDRAAVKRKERELDRTAGGPSFSYALMADPWKKS